MKKRTRITPDQSIVLLTDEHPMKNRNTPTQRELDEGADSIMAGIFNVEMSKERFYQYEQAHDAHEYKIVQDVER